MRRAPDNLEPGREWLLQAACRNAEDPDLWYSTDGSDIREARRICREKCPVAIKCLTAALRDEGGVDRKGRYGVVGGCTPRERHRLYTQRIAPKLQQDGLKSKQRGPGRLLSPCGTDSAYQRHARRREACETCRLAYNRRQRERRVAKAKRRAEAEAEAKRAARIEHGTAKGARQHWRLGETPCQPCRAAYNALRAAQRAVDRIARKRESQQPVGPACRTYEAWLRHRREGEHCEPCEIAKRTGFSTKRAAA